MTKVFNETKQQLSKASKQALNRRRWSSYVARLEKQTHDPQMAYRALMILMGSINAVQRWVRISEEDFLTLVPDWKENSDVQDWEVQRHGTIIQLHLYFDPRSEKYYFSRLFKRADNVLVLSGWHVAALNGVRSRGIEVTQGLSDELYQIGNMIVKSIREGEGIWRKPDNPMLDIPFSMAGV